jgi:aminopeptidase
MRDERIDRLARGITGYSLGLKAGEVVLIELRGLATLDLGVTLVREATALGAVPHVFFNDERFLRPFLVGCTEAQVKRLGEVQAATMREADAYVGVRGSDNPYDLADVPADARDWYQRHVWQKVHVEDRVRRTRWVVLRWPNDAMAQAAGASREAFEDFYFRVCTLDYARLGMGMALLAERMQRTRDVRIVAPGTDLRLCIAGMPAVICDGHRNLPDGEVYTAPVRESVEGVIRFNAPTFYAGQALEGVTLRFEQGRVVEATAANPSQTAALNRILDTDPGARSVGEFALGLNREIREPMRDILFDEKIAGSLHLALGNAYESAFNGNRSAVHWDLVLIQRPDHGGGEVWFDGELLRKDGAFVPPDLAAALDA